MREAEREKVQIEEKSGALLQKMKRDREFDISSVVSQLNTQKQLIESQT